MMNGKNEIIFDLFDKQMSFQNKITGIEKPIDNLEYYSYHVQAMVEEMGELVKADKRWKSIRNTHYDKEEKMDELADVFITVLNITMYSGFNIEDLLKKVDDKIEQNEERLREANKNEK